MTESAALAWSKRLSAKADGEAIPGWLTYRFSAVIPNVSQVVFLDVRVDGYGQRAQIVSAVAITKELLLTAGRAPAGNTTAEQTADVENHHIVVRPLSNIERIEVAGRDSDWRTQDGDIEPRTAAGSFRLVCRGEPQPVLLPLSSRALSELPAGLQAILTMFAKR